MSESTLSLEKEIKAFVEKVMEFHDLRAIRVFVTKKECDQCMGYNYGQGDIYSIQGYVDEWLEIQRERNRINVRRGESAPIDPGGVA